MVLVWAIAAICTFYLLQPCIFWLLSLFYKFPETTPSPQPHFSCIITVYKHMELASMLIESILKTKYTAFEIIVIADRARPEDLNITHPAVRVISPSQPLDAKLKSIELGLQNATTDSAGIIVFDPDNLTAPDFFSEIAGFVHLGFEVVQGIRLAKNQDTDIARAASLGEYYHNFCDRFVPFKALGSPSISGSGYYMSKSFAEEFFSSKLYEKKKRDVILGEDKLIQSYAGLSGKRIAFAPQAILYDEKIKAGTQVQQQRARWINSYFENLPMTVRLFRKGLSDRNALLMGISSSRPPMLILLLFSAILFGISLMFFPQIALLLAVGLVVFTLYFVIAVRNSPHAKRVSFFSIPVFVFHQFLALIKSRTQRKEFVVTKKDNSVSIDEMN